MRPRRLALLPLLASLVLAAGAAEQLPSSLANGSFELSLNGGPAGWRFEAQSTTSTPGLSIDPATAWARTGSEPAGGVGGSSCVVIEVTKPSAEDAAVWSQSLKLEPFTTYIVRGKIRGEGIRLGEGVEGDPVGPSITTSMWQSDTNANKAGVEAVGDFDWTPFALDVQTTRDGLLTVSLRFGTGGTIGKAYFDDLTVEPNPDTERFEGKHLVLNLYKDEVELATRAGVEQAVRNTDILCEAYAELTGDPLPDDLRLSAWSPKLWDIGALGWSSDPVEWVVLPEVLRDNWRIEGFCPEVFLHEYAHVFDRDRWSFEMHFSELFMYYACETRDMGFCEDSGWRRGAAVRDRWEIRGVEGVPNICAVIRKVIALRDRVGWEPFRQTYRWFQSLDRAPIESACLVAPDGTAGHLRREVWKDLEGETVADFTASPRFAGSPDLDETLSTLEATQSEYEGYGQRVTGFLVPPESGDYTLWLSADDVAELYLSTDEDPANKRRVATVTSYCDPRSALGPGQQSEPIALEAGKRYAVEVLHRDNGGGSHVSVAWSARPEDRITPEIATQLATRWGKMELYFAKLAEYGGVDPWSFFTPEEKEILRWAFSPRPEPTLRPAEAPAETKSLALGDAVWENASVGWEEPTRNALPGDMPLRSAEGVHFNGLYAHAASRYLYRLEGKWTSFETLYHLQKGHAGSVVFVVLGDGKELFRSDLVTDAAERSARLDVTGVDVLELITEDGGNGKSGDWGVWTETKVLR